MIHERECSHCGAIAQWRDVDPVPAKCLSCGAPPTRARTGGPRIRCDILYGYSAMRPEWRAKIIADSGSINNDTAHAAQSIRDQLVALGLWT